MEVDLATLSWTPGFSRGHSPLKVRVTGSSRSLQSDCVVIAFDVLEYVDLGPCVNLKSALHVVHLASALIKP